MTQKKINLYPKWLFFDAHQEFYVEIQQPLIGFSHQTFGNAVKYQIF